MVGMVGAIVGQEAGAVGGREASGAIAKHFGVGKNGQEVARNVGSRVGRLAGGAIGGFLSPFATGGVVGKGVSYRPYPVQRTQDQLGDVIRQLQLRLL